MSAKNNGASVKDIPAAKFIAALSAHLQASGNVELPSYVDIVKTGLNRELAPINPDWFYVRLASIFRRVYLQSGIGIGALARNYGGAWRSGCRKSHHRDASRAPIRHALAQLEKLNFIAKKEGEKYVPFHLFILLSFGDEDSTLVLSSSSLLYLVFNHLSFVYLSLTSLSFSSSFFPSSSSSLF